ncbi:MAG: DegT/DnrJ/EryC1/StrS family aminotransferase [Planctomycetes bacterium]|jgi:perosamine synthetase|nr:DegT/DnrJ/EryC1/StrS family aminotransferase [Planctomycetota bacterium]
MSTEMIQLFKPWYDDREIEAVAEVLRSGWVGLGPKTAEFEKRFAQFSGAACCVGLNSCTAALDMAMRLLGVNHGDEVIVPTVTFVSTAHCIAYNLGTPIFADVNERTLDLDATDVARKIGPRTKAIIAVHYGGRPVDMDALKQVAGSIPIVEDCAHATGARYKGRSVGGLGAVGCFSFHAVKNLAMGEGGALTINDKQMAQRAKRLRWLGIDKGTWDRTALDKSYWWEYSVDEIGLKSHLNDVHAAIGLVQLAKLEEANRRRRAIVDAYRQAFADIPQIRMPAPDDADFESAWHLCEILAESRDELSVFLQERNISTGVHYKPIHLYRCYGNRPSLPVAEGLFPRMLSLPLHPGLTDEQVRYIIATLRRFYGK